MHTYSGEKGILAARMFGAPSVVISIEKRIRMMGESVHPAVIEAFLLALELPKDDGSYLHHVDEIYKNDEYHSLSIED